MRVVHVSTEFAPLAKAGGLGEVLVGLVKELARNGAKVDIIMPKYDFISLSDQRPKLQFFSPEWEHQILNTMWAGTSQHCNLLLLETQHPKKYFHRGKIYGCEDDVPRFLYFSRAVAEYLKMEKEPIDVLHLHDWHGAALAPLFREILKDVPIRSIVLNIHNIEYQGPCSSYDLEAIGLKREHTARFQTGDHFNLLKGGITYADAIVAVSPTYAQEILTDEYGFGLSEELRSQKHKLSGILNGIDLELWDPSTDPALPRRYSASDPISKILDAKLSSRKAIGEKFHLRTDVPWFGAITRLVSQKGPHLIEAALREVAALKGVFVLLGSAPNIEIHRQFERLQREFDKNPHAFLYLGYDEVLAHELYAALDFIVVPSLFEPCGLTQLIAMHYGTVPLVRSTGGLKDTVFDCEDASIPQSRQNGFTFLPPKPDAVNHLVQRALKRKQNNPTAHQLLMKHGMEADFSWKKPAQEYLSLYRRLSRA